MIKATKNLTEGSVLRNAIELSWPMIVSYLLQFTINLVDIKMISILGTRELAAIGIGQQFIILAFLIFTAVSVGASIYVSQYTGKNDLEKVRETVVQTILLSVFVGVSLSILAFFFLESFMSFLNAEKEVLKLSHNYTIIIFYFAPIMLLNYTVNSIFRSTGDSKTPLFIMLSINVLNFVFNYLLIFGIWIFPEMKMEGAAIGTGISRGIGLIISLSILYRRDLLFKVTSIKKIFTTASYIPRYGPMRKIFTLGLPSALQDISWGISMIIIYKIVSMLPQSTKALSAFSVSFNIEAICFMPGIAFMQAATIMVGQHLGASKIESAGKVAWINVGFGSLFMALLGLPMVIMPEFVLSLFTKDSSVIEIGRTYLILMGSTQVFIGIKFILMGAINGAGDTKTPFWIEFLEIWVFRVPPIIIFVLYLGYQTKAVWLSMALSNVVGAIATFLIFRTGYWKKLKLLEKND